MPTEIQANIYAHLDYVDQMCLALTCKLFARVATIVKLKNVRSVQRVKATGHVVNDYGDSYDERRNSGLNRELMRRLVDWVPATFKLCRACYKFRSNDKNYWLPRFNDEVNKTWVYKWAKGTTKYCPRCNPRLTQRELGRPHPTRRPRFPLLFASSDSE